MWKKAIFTLAFAAAAPLLVQCAASGGASGSVEADPGDGEASGSVSGSSSAGTDDGARSTSTTTTR